MPMQPNPTAETSRLPLPSLRFYIASRFSFCDRFAHPHGRLERRGSGIPILPIHCLFLSHHGVLFYCRQVSEVLLGQEVSNGW